MTVYLLQSKRHPFIIERDASALVQALTKQQQAVIKKERELSDLNAQLEEAYAAAAKVQATAAVREPTSVNNALCSLQAES